MINQNIPDAWGSYVTQTNLGLEVIPAVLYDTLVYTSATTTRLTFFQQTNVNLDISNMKQSGMLPNPEAFLIQSIRFFAKQQLTTVAGGAAGALASPANDLILLSNTGVLELKIGNKQYGPWPLWMLPASTFVQVSGEAAGASATDFAWIYAQIGGPLYPLFPNLMLSPLQNFVVTLSWPSGAITASTASTSLEVMLDGQLARSIQ